MVDLVYLKNIASDKKVWMDDVCKKYSLSKKKKVEQCITKTFQDIKESWWIYKISNLPMNLLSIQPSMKIGGSLVNARWEHQKHDVKKYSKRFE